MPDKLYRYEGHYYCQDEAAPGWVALIGGADYTRHDLARALAVETNPEQKAELEEALAALPPEDTVPKRGQRRKPKPAEGDPE